MNILDPRVYPTFHMKKLVFKNIHTNPVYTEYDRDAVLLLADVILQWIEKFNNAQFNVDNAVALFFKHCPKFTPDEFNNILDEMYKIKNESK